MLTERRKRFAQKKNREKKTFCSKKTESRKRFAQKKKERRKKKQRRKRFAQKRQREENVGNEKILNWRHGGIYGQFAKDGVLNVEKGIIWRAARFFFLL